MPLTMRTRRRDALCGTGGLLLLLAASTGGSAQSSARLVAPADTSKVAPHNIPPAQSDARYVHPISLAQDYSHYLKLVSPTPGAPPAAAQATPPHPQPPQRPTLLELR